MKASLRSEQGGTHEARCLFMQRLLHTACSWRRGCSLPCWREAWLLTTLHAQETKIDIEMDIDEMQIVIEVIVEIKEEIEIEVDIEIEKGQ